MVSFGASVGLESKETAVRVPVPVTTKAIALPEAQPGRFTICCTMLARLGVFSLGPTSLTTVQGTGAHATVAVVRGRPETFKAAFVNAAALSLASPANVRSVAPDQTSSAAN